MENYRDQNVNCRGFIFEWARRCDVFSLKPLYIPKRPLIVSCIFFIYFNFNLFFSYAQMEDSLPVQNKEKSSIYNLQGCRDKQDAFLIHEPLKDRTFRSNAFFPVPAYTKKKRGTFLVHLQRLRRRYYRLNTYVHCPLTAALCIVAICLAYHRRWQFVGNVNVSKRGSTWDYWKEATWHKANEKVENFTCTDSDRNNFKEFILDIQYLIFYFYINPRINEIFGSFGK